MYVTGSIDDVSLKENPLYLNKKAPTVNSVGAFALITSSSFLLE